MAALLVNTWHLRKVAETSAKPCDICYKPSSSVLITPDNKDHFYICPGHLKDRGFCSPIISEVEVAAKKKKKEEDLEKEIEAVKKEYEEKVKKKKKDKKKKQKEEEEEGKSKKKESKGKESAKDDNDDDDNDKAVTAAATKERDEKIKALTAAAHQSTNTTSTSTSTTSDEIPRIYSLQKIFYQRRIDRIRNAELAKRNRDRLKNPALFPEVPSGELG